MIFTNADPITVCQLGSCVSHGLSPDIVSSASTAFISVFGICKKNLLLGRDDLRVVEEGWTRVLSLVLDRTVISAVEMGVLLTI